MQTRSRQKNGEQKESKVKSKVPLYCHFWNSSWDILRLPRLYQAAPEPLTQVERRPDWSMPIHAETNIVMSKLAGMEADMLS